MLVRVREAEKGDAQRSGLAAGVGLEFRPPVPLLIEIIC